MLLRLNKLNTTVLGTLNKNQSPSLLLADLQVNLNLKYLVKANKPKITKSKALGTFTEDQGIRLVAALGPDLAK